MEEWLKKRAALYQLIKLVDDNHGSITVNTNKVKRVFNDADDIVKVEYKSGDVALLADADFEIINNIVLNWLSNNGR